MGQIERIGPADMDWACPCCQHAVTTLVRDLVVGGALCPGCKMARLADYIPKPHYVEHETRRLYDQQSRSAVTDNRAP